MMAGLVGARAQGGVALRYAAVPRVDLGSTAPPLCRFAECHTALRPCAFGLPPLHTNIAGYRSGWGAPTTSK